MCGVNTCTTSCGRLAKSRLAAGRYLSTSDPISVALKTKFEQDCKGTKWDKAKGCAANAEEEITSFLDNLSGERVFAKKDNLGNALYSLSPLGPWKYKDEFWRD